MDYWVLVIIRLNPVNDSVMVSLLGKRYGRES